MKVKYLSYVDLKEYEDDFDRDTWLQAFYDLALDEEVLIEVEFDKNKKPISYGGVLIRIEEGNKNGANWLVADINTLLSSYFRSNVVDEFSIVRHKGYSWLRLWKD